MPDANELKLLASRQEQAFQERFGYPASEVPGIWVGQYVALNMLGGRGSGLRLERDTPEPADPSDPLEDPGTIGTE